MDILEERRKEALIFRKYLDGKRILIADPNTTSRIGMLKIIQDLGGQIQLIQMVNSFVDAKESIEKWKPHMVVSEYTLGKSSGLDLLMAQRAQRPNETRECLFVIVTSNSSQSAVARSAEEEIDGFILKPFNADTVRNVLLRAAIQKISPTPYSIIIEEAKALIAEGKLDEAQAKLEPALTLTSNPSLAHYYLAQIRYLKQTMDQAKGHYETGLGFNRIHYKCLVGLYDLLIQQKSLTDAYEVVKKISQYFPANPKRLTEVLRLAILTSNYDDIEKYYAVFSNIDETNDEMVRYVGAALVVCGKHYLNNRLAHARAVDLFQKAAAVSRFRAPMLKEIIINLVEAKLDRPSADFLQKFLPQDQKTIDYQLSKFLVYDLNERDPRVFDLGRDLVNKKVVNDRLFASMIKRAVKGGLRSVAKEISDLAVQSFPKRKEEFEALLVPEKPEKSEKTEKPAAKLTKP